MRPIGSAQQLEDRRRLAVRRVEEGWRKEDVAAFLGVTPRAVNGWLARHRADPQRGLQAKAHPGRTPKLNAEQEAVILSWFRRSATEFGFPTELWTAGRVALLIERHFGIRFNSHYLSAWLARRRITPQKPVRQARERDPVKVARWQAEVWPRVKKNSTPGLAWS